MTELETYEHILAVAMSLIAEKGFANTSMNDIVKATGLSKGGIYWHFKSKDEIIDAIVENVFSEQMAFLDAVLAGEGRASERLLRLVAMIAESLREENTGVPSPIDIYAIAIRKADLLEHIKTFFGHYQTHFADLLLEGMAEGEFSIEDPDNAAFIFMSSIEGIILVNAISGQSDRLSQTLTYATQLFLRGIQAGA